LTKVKSALLTSRLKLILGIAKSNKQKVICKKPA
jgi:hypothetical protein